ncbi:ABC transporter permease [Brucella anthropi]|uniref:ABC transporter permease n=1 Tax=Brucella anthropi TaxID=529 RepID=UPI001CFEB398|nr:ABC transporter permease [Brucella anthropi]
MVISYPFAYFISIQKPRLRAVLLLMTVVTMWVSVLVRTYAWMVVLGKEGLMNSAMQSLGIIDQPMQLIFTRGAVYLAMVQILLPITILATYSGMVSFDRTYYLASRILGATPIKAFLTVYLPMTISGVASGGLLVLLLSLGFFITPAMVGGPNDMLISNIISNEVTQTMNWNLAAALSLVLLIIGAMLVAIFLYVFKKIARI